MAYCQLVSSCDKAYDHILHCNVCFQNLAKLILNESARRAGSTITKAKSEAARLNGMKGGRPRRKK